MDVLIQRWVRLPTICTVSFHAIPCNVRPAIVRFEYFLDVIVIFSIRALETVFACAQEVVPDNQWLLVFSVLVNVDLCAKSFV